MDLAEGARRYAAQARHRRAAAVGAGVVAVAVFGWLLAQGVTRDQGARLAQSPPALTCAGLPVDRGKPRAVSAALSTRATAVLVCADRSDASIWPGSLPPDEPLHLAQGLDYLPLGPPVDGDARCPRLPVGPAFTITVQGKDGRFVTYDNVDLACNGWPTLDQYFIALGEQQSVESFDPRIDPFPPCPSILGEELRVPHGGPPGIPKGTVFVTGSACLHQTPEPSAVPRFRRPDRSVLGSQALAALTREAATHGSGPAFAGCDDAVPGGPIVVARLVTQQGRLIELTGSPGCGLELLVNWTPGDYWTVAQGTADSVAADFGGFPR